jgi:hypothetical protein
MLLAELRWHEDAVRGRIIAWLAANGCSEKGREARS